MITIRLIQQRTAEHFGLSLDDINGPRRFERIAWARHVSMFLSRELLRLSYPHLAIEFRKKSHGAILHGCRSVADLMSVSTQDRAQVAELRRKLELEIETAADY